MEQCLLIMEGRLCIKHLQHRLQVSTASSSSSASLTRAGVSRDRARAAHGCRTEQVARNLGSCLPVSDVSGAVRLCPQGLLALHCNAKRGALFVSVALATFRHSNHCGVQIETRSERRTAVPLRGQVLRDVPPGGRLGAPDVSRGARDGFKGPT